MSRSYRHVPISGVSIKYSEKKDKKILNKKLRKKAKTKLSKEKEDYLEPKKEEILDRWNMAKDGKFYWGNIEDKEEIDKRIRK